LTKSAISDIISPVSEISDKKIAKPIDKPDISDIILSEDEKPAGKRRKGGIMQKVELRTSSRRHVCGQGIIIGFTKRYIKVKVVEVASTITRVKPGDVINFSRLDCRSKNGFSLGL